MTNCVFNKWPAVLSALLFTPLCSTSTALYAQRASAPMFVLTGPAQGVATRTPAGQRSVPVLVASSLAFGAIGLYGGALIGDKVASGCEGEDCSWPALFSGAGIGMSALIPLGVHLANNRKGNYPFELLASGVICAAGAALGFSGSPGALLAIPPAQILTSILIERKTAS